MAEVQFRIKYPLPCNLIVKSQSSAKVSLVNPPASMTASFLNAPIAPGTTVIHSK